MSKTIFEAYNFCKKKLHAAKIEDYAFESRVIIRHITGLNNSQILTSYSNKLTEYQENNLIAIIHQREVRYPLQYILGEWSFYGRDFFVGPGVLIPRSDTETLIDVALQLAKEKETPKILDLCAGSGCIGITLAAERKDAQVTLLEKYNEAISFLQKNVRRNSTENATVLQGDVFQNNDTEKYDLIVSNPPYVTQDEMKELSEEVKFEPETALLAQDNGLEFYKEIAESYKKNLVTGGSLCFEVGYKQSDAVREILERSGYTDVSVKKDANDVERVVFGTLKSI